MSYQLAETPQLLTVSGPASLQSGQCGWVSVSTCGGEWEAVGTMHGTVYMAISLMLAPYMVQCTWPSALGAVVPVC